MPMYKAGMTFLGGAALALLALPTNWFDPNAWMKMFQLQGAKDDAKTTTQ